MKHNLVKEFDYKARSSVQFFSLHFLTVTVMAGFVILWSVVWLYHVTPFLRATQSYIDHAK